MNLEGIIPLVSGVYVTLLAFEVVASNKDPKRHDQWMRKWAPSMKFVGPAMILFGIVLLLRVFK